MCVCVWVSTKRLCKTYPLKITKFFRRTVAWFSPIIESTPEEDRHLQIRSPQICWFVGIPPTLRRKSIPEMFHFLSHLYNKCPTAFSFPSVVNILAPKSRVIFLLPLFDKILEVLINAILVKHFTPNDLWISSTAFVFLGLPPIC